MIFPYSPRLADWLEAEAVFIEAKDADGARSYTVGGSSLMLSARKLADEAKGNLQGVERVIWPLYKVEPWSSPALLRKLAAELRGPGTVGALGEAGAAPHVPRVQAEREETGSGTEKVAQRQGGHVSAEDTRMEHCKAMTGGSGGFREVRPATADEIKEWRAIEAANGRPHRPDYVHDRDLWAFDGKVVDTEADSCDLSWTFRVLLLSDIEIPPRLRVRIASAIRVLRERVKGGYETAQYWEERCKWVEAGCPGSDDGED